MNSLWANKQVWKPHSCRVKAKQLRSFRVQAWKRHTHANAPTSGTCYGQCPHMTSGAVLALLCSPRVCILPGASASKFLVSLSRQRPALLDSGFLFQSSSAAYFGHQCSTRPSCPATSCACPKPHSGYAAHRSAHHSARAALWQCSISSASHSRTTMCLVPGCAQCLETFCPWRKCMQRAWGACVGAAASSAARRSMTP